MNAKTFIYKYSDNTGVFSASVMSSFNNPTQIVDYSILDDKKIEIITSIFWCINAAGYVELQWEGKNGNSDIPFVNLSGNGRWDLGAAAFQIPSNSTGRVFLNTQGFDDLDSFTIIVNGKTIKE